MCQTRDGSDNVLRRDMAEGELNVNTQQKLIYMPDQLGSVRDVLDGTTGALVDAYDYAPYGSNDRSYGTTAPTDYRFAGLLLHPASGLNLGTYRALDGVTGRFINRDPMGFKGGINFYDYTESNPINATDPLGLCGDDQSSTNKVVRPFRRTFPCNTNAAGAIANLENNFAGMADWSAGPLSVTFLQHGPLTIGQPILIDGILGAGHWYSGLAGTFATAGVSVSSVGSNSFMFTTIPGEHPFDNGTVSFSAYDAGNGNITFSVNVNASFSGLGSEAAFYMLGGSLSESSIWNNLIDNVEAACQN